MVSMSETVCQRLLGLPEMNTVPTKWSARCQNGLWMPEQQRGNMHAKM